jgi:uncharacterized protein (TIGR02452 family)
LIILLFRKMTHATYDVAKWLEAFHSAKEEKNFDKVKALRRQITLGTQEHTKGLPQHTTYKRVVVCEEALPVREREALRTQTMSIITVRDMDCLESERQLRERGLNPCVLNMASCHRPGGGWLNGAGAQEENLFYRSDYARHLPKSAYPFKTPVTAIYSPDVLVFRESENLGYAYSSEPRHVAFIAAAAVKEPELTPEGDLPEAAFNLTKAKIRQVLRLALMFRHDSIVLSAWGCGAYKNPPRSVALAFKEVLVDEDEFRGQFAAVEFAIFDDHNSAKEGNFATFEKTFLSSHI